MPCYKPRLAYQHKTVKQPLRFIHSQNGARQDNGTQKGDSGFFKVINDMSQYRTISIPCGQCIDCRLRNSQEKAIRLVHESKMSPTGQNCFLTLTYNDENLPRDQLGNAVYNPTHLTSFVARLRDHLRYSLQVKNFSKVPEALRFKTFGCAEYGDQFDRPHFHLLILNYDFKDKYPWRQTTPDWGGEPNQCYRSEFLESLWSHGNSEIGSVTEQSCGYVARYVQKKITGKMAEKHYNGRPPERLLCNSKGIGLSFLKSYMDPIANFGTVIWKNKEIKLPRYYEKKLEQLDPLRYAALKQKQISSIDAVDLDQTKSRLETREELHEIKAKQLKRNL